MVKLILAIETCRESDKGVTVGKIMNDDNGEKLAAKAARTMISQLCGFANDEYGCNALLEDDFSAPKEAKAPSCCDGESEEIISLPGLDTVFDKLLDAEGMSAR